MLYCVTGKFAVYAEYLHRIKTIVSTIQPRITPTTFWFGGAITTEFILFAEDISYPAKSYFWLYGSAG